MTIGRNDPCPCGSGKKYKKCCIDKGSDPVNYMKQKIDRFHERIVDELMGHGEKVFSSEALYEAIDEFFGWPEEEEAESLDLEGHLSVFYPWYLFKWRVESADGESALPGPKDMSIVQSYLQTHGRKLDPVEREYLESFAHAPFGFFEITVVEPGESLTLRDLLLDCDHHILEKSASRSLQKGDVVFGSAFETRGTGLLGAMSMIAFNPSSKIEILAVREMMSTATQGRITSETLEEYDMELRDLYLDLYAAMTIPPALCNTDGDEISVHTLKYTISSPRKVFDALKGLTGGFASEEDLLEEAEFDAKGGLRKVEVPWLVPGNEKHGGMENTVHGRITIDGKKMTCEVNSAERAERLRALIEKKLPGGEATYKTTVVQSADAMMRERTPSASADAEHEALMEHPEVRAHIEEMMRKHWEAWPDMALPALEGRTPRQAVKNKLGRQQVSALLEDAERSCRSQDGPLGDLENLQRVRRELGLKTS